MTYNCFNKLSESEFDNIVSRKNAVQDLNINQLELQVHDAYQNEKLTTTFKDLYQSDDIYTAYLDKKLSKIDGHLSFLEKDHNEFKLHNKEDILIEKAVRTTIQLLYDEGLFDNFDNADQVSKEY